MTILAAAALMSAGTAAAGAAPDATGCHRVGMDCAWATTCVEADATQRPAAATTAPPGAAGQGGGATADKPQQGIATPSPEDDYTTVSITMQEQSAWNLLVSDRNAHGLAPLTLDPELCRIARIKSEDMRDGGYFAHESPTYGRVKDMLRRFGYEFAGAGENIAHHATVEKAQAAFMSSAGHRRNVLSAAWTKAGVGVCYDRNGFVYVTQIFAR